MTPPSLRTVRSAAILAFCTALLLASLWRVRSIGAELLVTAPTRWLPGSGEAALQRGLDRLARRHGTNASGLAGLATYLHRAMPPGALLFVLGAPTEQQSFTLHCLHSLLRPGAVLPLDELRGDWRAKARGLGVAVFVLEVPTRAPAPSSEAKFPLREGEGWRLWRVEGTGR